MTKQHLTVDGASSALGVTPRAIHRWLSRGKCGGATKVKGQWRIPEQPLVQASDFGELDSKARDLPAFSPRLYKDELVDWLSKLPAPCFMTGNFNPRDPMSVDSGKRQLVFLWQVLNRKFLGPRWSRKEPKIRLIAFPEHLESNLHFHCLVMLPNPGDLERFMREAPYLFRDKCIRGGQLHAVPIATGQDRFRIASYITKSLYDRRVKEGYVVLQ